MPEKRPIPAPIPEEILEALQRYAWRVRVVRLVRGTGVTLAVGAALLLGALLLDRFVYLEPPHRVLVTGAVAAAAAIAFLLAVVAPLLRPLGPFRLALGLEAACPELRERLVTALELLRAEAPSGSEELATRLVSSTADALADLPVGRLVRWRPALARLAAGAAAALLLAALAAGDPEGHALLLARFLHPTRDLPRPSDVFLAVLPGSGVAPLGEDVTVRATVLAGRPERAELLLDRGDGFRPLEMKRGDGQFSGTVPRPRGPFAYHVASSRFRSPTYRIEVRERPAARSFDVLYTYPATTRLPPARATSTSGALSAPAGSVAEIAVRCSRPVAAARLHVSGEEPVNAAPEGDTVRVTVPVRRPGSWRLWLEDSDRISNLWGEVHPIDAVPDRPPQVRAIEPREAVRVETAAPVEVKFEASDDHGVRAIETRIDRGRGEVLKVPVPVGDPPPDRRAPDGRVTALAGAFRLDLAELGMEPGERLEWRLAAVDEAGQEGLSPPRSIELALAPPPPEGEGWNARLDAIGAEIEKALAAAAACATAAAHGGEALPIDEALADRLSERSRELEELRMSFPRLSDDVRATARRIAFPSANRPALEGLARRLGDVASGSLAAFAGELLRATGAIREALRARGKAGAPGPASVPVEALASGGRLLGEDLARSAALFAAIHREERLEASVEGLIELGAALRRLGSHLDPKRKETRGLVRTLWS
ncbi:MAG: DUF4175 family protein, partial [Planctomycetes bacterium]|nr:DUF4175 family protein [Planctomycetota bacterium]